MLSSPSIFVTLIAFLCIKLYYWWLWHKFWVVKLPMRWRQQHVEKVLSGHLLTSPSASGSESHSKKDGMQYSSVWHEHNGCEPAACDVRLTFTRRCRTPCAVCPQSIWFRYRDYLMQRNELILLIELRYEQKHSVDVQGRASVDIRSHGHLAGASWVTLKCQSFKFEPQLWCTNWSLMTTEPTGSSIGATVTATALPIWCAYMWTRKHTTVRVCVDGLDL